MIKGSRKEEAVFPALRYEQQGSLFQISSARKPEVVSDPHCH